MRVIKDSFYFFVGIVISLVVFAVNTYPIFEGDLFWHMKTGEWILQNASLPYKDPFNYTTYMFSGDKIPTRVEFVLTSYWLGQVILFLLWKLGGSAMIVLSRALTYSCIITILCIWIGKSSRGLLAITGLLLVGTELYYFPNERPQLFSYIFFTLMLYLLEQTRCQNRISVASWLIPAIMFIWSNTHGAYLLGDVVIIIYMISHIICNFRKPTLNHKYIMLLFAAFIASTANPNHLLGIKELLNTYNFQLTATITEYMSPLKNFSHPSFLVLAIAITLLLVISIKTVSLEHMVTLLFLITISMYNIRYIPFFLFSIPIAYTYLSDNVNKKLQSIIVVFVLLLAITQPWKGALTYGINPAYPEQSVKFINDTKPSGPLFNFVNWGGYIMFFSQYSVFCDGRYLTPKFRGYHDDILTKPYGIKILDKYGISTVIIPGTNPYIDTGQHGQPLQLLTNLSKDEKWVLVHYDSAAIVFVRDIPENGHVIRKHRKAKESVINHIQLRQSAMPPVGL